MLRHQAVQGQDAGECEENYFMLMSEQVLRKEISFKTLAENHQTYMEIEKVNAVLAQISEQAEVEKSSEYSKS